MKLLGIRLSCVCVFLSLFLASSFALSWEQTPQRPYFQNENDDQDDDDYADDQEANDEKNLSDGGSQSDTDAGPLEKPKKPKAPKKKTEGDDEKKEASPKEKAPTPPAATPPAATPPAATPPAATPPAARPPAARPPAATPPRVTPPSVRPPTLNPFLGLQKGVAGTKSKKIGQVISNQNKVDNGFDSASISSELKVYWVLCGLFLLSFFLLFLHFIIPVQGLSFLSKGSHLLLILGAVGLGAMLIYRFFFVGHLPGTSSQSSLMWFAFTGLIAYTWQRSQHPDVYIGSGMVLLISTAAISWILAGQFVIPTNTTNSLHHSAWWVSSNIATYTAFGLLAASGSWLLSSIFLGVLAKRNRGSGYGLRPSQWEEYRLTPSFFVFWAYPLLTLAMVGQILWSHQYTGEISFAWSTHPRLWSVPVVWLLLSAHLFALRSPKAKNPSDEFDDLLDNDLSPVTGKPRKLPGFLLFLATVGGSFLFVGAHAFIKYFSAS